MSLPELHRTRPAPLERARGAALLVALIALLALAILSTAVIVMSQGDHKISANERDAERALFASKAGLNHAYYLLEQGLITPTLTGAVFDSSDASVSAALQGATFAGRVYDDSASLSRGQLYRIDSTGTFRRGRRTTELVFQVVPDAFKYGYAAFNEAVLHNHSGLAGPTFRIESTVFSNGAVKVPNAITLEGTIVAGGLVEIEDDATIEGSIFANAVDFIGSGQTVDGSVKLITALESLPAAAASWDRVDSLGSKYDWFDGHSSPGTVTGGGTITGGQSSYTIQNGDIFRSSVTRRDGRILPNPDLNVVLAIEAPRLDFAAMKAEADLNDPTYFTSMTDAMDYLVSKKVTEVIDGKSLVTIKVGTAGAPEFLYVADDFILTLYPPGGSGDDTSIGLIEADGFHLEGGIYAAGDFEFNGQPFDPALHPSPPDYYQLKITALPHCYPAIVAYSEPSSGSVATWTPDDTPVISSGGSKLMMKSDASPHEGFVFLHGVTFSQGQTHLHHTESADELIRFIGAELAFKVHNCDYFQFTYDPAVVCTRFLVTDQGTPTVVSYRERR